MGAKISQKSRKNLLRKPSYSQFCPKFRCHSNQGKGKRTWKGNIEGKGKGKGGRGKGRGRRMEGKRKENGKGERTREKEKRKKEETGKKKGKKENGKGRWKEDSVRNVGRTDARTQR